MSVAAQEACLLRRLLGETANEADPLARLASTYFAALPGLLEAPWSSAALDLIYPQTTGARPPDFEGRLRFAPVSFASLRATATSTSCFTRSTISSNRRAPIATQTCSAA